VVGDEAAGGGADDRGQSKHATEESGGAAPLVGREKVPNDGEHSREQHTAEQALDAPEDDQLVHVLGQATKRGGDDEADHPREQEGLAPEQVAELAGDRGHRRRRHEVGRRHPGQAVEAVEVSHYARDRGTDDRLVERRQQQGEHGACRREKHAPA